VAAAGLRALDDHIPELSASANEAIGWQVSSAWAHVEWDAVPETFQHQRADDALSIAHIADAARFPCRYHQRQVGAVYLAGLQRCEDSYVKLRLDGHS